MSERSGKKYPDCAYVEGTPCKAFDFRFRRPVCGGYDDETGELFRCPLLPSWVRDGYHDAVYIDGKLVGEHRHENVFGT